MVAVLVVHNNESDRLAYLRPKLDSLSIEMGARGWAMELHLVGPDSDLIVANRAAPSLANRVKRAYETALMFGAFSANDPRVRSTIESARVFLRQLWEHLFHYGRSILIEQEVLYAHAYCWRESLRRREPVIVLESDAIFHEHSATGLVAILEHLASVGHGHYYVDLAGGCDRREILNSWCFEAAYGCESRPLSLDPPIEMLSLPRLTGNTVGGYVIGPELASELLDFVERARPMLPPDWAMNLFCVMRRPRAPLCIHTTPTIFSQGSSIGAYRSGISPTTE